jgi:cytidine deaminase
LNEYSRLLKHARTAQKRSHSPYSRFRVGSALLTAGGKIYKGCNIEVSSYGLTICAERTAVFKAVSEGERSFKAIAIVSDERGFISPCGACRQVIMDLAGDIDVIMSNGSGKWKVLKMSDLLPHPFGPKDLTTVGRKKR